MNKKMQVLGAVVMTAMFFSVTVLTGCKKDEEGGGGSTSITQIKMKKSTETVNIGTTVTLEYETTPAGIAPKIERWSSANADIASVSDNGVVTGIAEGSVYVRVKVNNQFMDSCKVTVVSSITDLSANGTANSYIVSGAGEYKFKATVKGNCADSTISPTGYSVLWESFGTDSVPKAGALVKNVFLVEGYVYFIASAEKGNAVIAAMDGTNVLWSWHIWLTDVPAGQIYNNTAGTMMDRNLGATSVDKGQVGALGLFYQWGRKDPFPGPSSVSSSAWASSTGFWNIESVEKAIPVGDSTTLVYSTRNPMTFIYPEKNPFDWYCADSKYQDSTLWNKNDKKTIYDPCPVGWRVPAGGESGIWSTAFGSSSRFIGGPWDPDGLGMDFGNSSSHSLGKDAAIWYPAVGYLDYDVFLNAVGSTGYYWSCTTPGTLNADVFHFGSSSLVNLLESKYRAYGFSVRCVKE